MSARRLAARRRTPPGGPVGQVLVLFVLFLLVLLGVSALAIDYATWLLTDRSLQNISDHIALAGAGEFDERQSQGSCGGGSGLQKCINARALMWTEANEELGLGLDAAAIALLSLSDSGPNGTTTVTAGGNTYTWVDRIWIATPPPTYAAYTGQGGRFAQNYGVTFARVDRDVRSFLGGALGITPDPRHGWATAGALPTDFALEVFCRNNIAPENGVCVNSAALTIDGQGGIRLLRGDIGSNESLTVTANNGGGAVVESGNVFLVNRTCAPNTWNCPNGPPSLGGISDGVNGKNAFYIAPIPVPQFESPINANTVSAYNCSGADATHLCVPRQDQASANPGSPGDWTCSASSSTPIRCGVPVVDTTSTPSTVSCIGQGGGSPQLHYYPSGINSGAGSLNADPGHPQSPASNLYLNVDDDFDLGDPDTDPNPDPPDDWVYTDNINISGAGGPQTTTVIFNLDQSGPRIDGPSTVRYVVFWTDEQTNGDPTASGNGVTVDVALLPGSGSTPIAVDAQRTLTDTPTRYEFTIGANVIPDTEFNSLRLRFVFTSSGSTAAADERGGGISWAEIQHPDPQPALPPMIPPGYYRSIVIPNDSCAILDPLAEYSSLLGYQMPGIYRFSGGGGGGPNLKKIKVGDGSFLIGDGVTLVFDPDWPDSGANQGVAIGANGALVLNTMRVPGVPPCTPSETETTTANWSAPLPLLQYSAVCAAWGIDHSVTTGIRPGANAWAPCDPANAASARCGFDPAVDYDPVPSYRGITFYFTPSAWPPSGITNRFEMQGGSGNDAGIAFRGVLYAPYDDVKITGGNGFNTVGQVLAWTAKFNGGSAYIDLDYPYDYTPASPYLLEPTIAH